MNVITPGYKYELAYFPDDGVSYRTPGQILQFIEKDRNAAGDFITVNDGTTNEEVLLMLIFRIRFLNAKAPCRENAIVLTKLEESLFWLNSRTKDRVERGVIGTPKV